MHPPHFAFFGSVLSPRDCSAVFIDRSISVVMRNEVFEHNVAYEGGAISLPGEVRCCRNVFHDRLRTI